MSPSLKLPTTVTYGKVTLRAGISFRDLLISGR